MPAYVDSPVLEASVLTPGRPIVLWDDESVSGSPDPGASQRFCMHRDKNFPNCFSVEVEFSANPGAFQIDIQTADTDEDKYYVTKASLTTGLNEDFVGRVEVINVIAKFARVRMVQLTEDVNVSARIY